MRCGLLDKVRKWLSDNKFINSHFKINIVNNEEIIGCNCHTMLATVDNDKIDILCDHYHDNQENCTILDDDSQYFAKLERELLSFRHGEINVKKFE